MNLYLCQISNKPIFFFEVNNKIAFNTDCANMTIYINIVLSFVFIFDLFFFLYEIKMPGICKISIKDFYIIFDIYNPGKSFQHSNIPFKCNKCHVLFFSLICFVLW